MSELIKKLEEEQKCVRDANFDSRTNFCTPEGYGFIKGFDYCLSLVKKNEQPQLNENQEAVLEWLKENAMVWELENIFSEAGGEILNAYDALTYREQFEVLQAFAEWGVKETTK